MPDQERIDGEGPVAASWPKRAVWVGLSGVLIAHGWLYTFLCDDAFISFRYARNLARGNGLVFNLGEHVEGYSNFLWVLQLAVFAGLGVPLESAALGLSWLATGVAVLVFTRLAWTSPVGAPGTAAVVAMLLLSTNRSFAVWCTSGLETRQLTALVLGGVLLVSLARSRSALLWAGSVFVLAGLARPEGLWLGAWAGAWLLVESLRTGQGIREGLRRVVLFGAPQVCGAAAHLGFRLAYYGSPLPNPFYAKSGEPWLEAGLVYLGGAAVEHGLVVLGPLAVVGAWARLRKGDGLHVLSALLVVPHLAVLAWIGGDHFEYRMLDLAFVLLHLAAADGIVALGSALPRPAVGTTVLAVGALAYAIAIPALDHVATRALSGRAETANLHAPLRPEHGRAWLLLPGMGRLVAAHNRLRRWGAARLVATRQLEHAEFWREGERRWGGYRGVRLPEGLVMVDGVMGVLPYRLEDVTFIDRFGLTDREIARMPTVRRSDQVRRLAHPHKPFRAYADARTNLHIRPHATRRSEALGKARFALRLGPGSWMPFHADAVPEPLRDSPVFARAPSTDGDAIPLVHEGVEYRIRRVLWTFDTYEGWSRTGVAFTRPSARARPPQAPVTGGVGGSFATSWHPELHDRARGTLRSPAFSLARGEKLAFVVGGGDRDVGVTLHGPDGPIETVSGRRSEALRMVVLDPGEHTGQPLHLEVFDRSVDGWGHVLVDHVVVLGER